MNEGHMKKHVDWAVKTGYCLICTKEMRNTVTKHVSRVDVHTAETIKPGSIIELFVLW